MTRTSHSIRFVLILAAVIGIHGQDGVTPREATLAIKSNFEDGLSDREFKVEYPGIAGISSATIKIFRVGDSQAKVDHTFKDGVNAAKTLYFELKPHDAPAGSYEVQVCITPTLCSARRAALGELFDEDGKPALTCSQGEDPFERTAKGEITKIKINGGKNFLTKQECDELPKEFTAYSRLGMTKNPEYKELEGKPVFYAVVWYEGKLLAKLFETIKTEGYCSRKYVFWASAHIVDKTTKEVKSRFRGTITVSQGLATKYILDPAAPDFPVEFVRHDDKKLSAGTYEVSVSFCASDKDRINSSVCSQAIYKDLTIE